MNALDLFALVLVVVALILGWRSGAVPQVFGLIGAAVGLIAAVQVMALFRVSLDSMLPAQRTIIGLLALFLGMAAGEGVGSAVGAAIRGRVASRFFEQIDRIGGSALAAAQALLLIWLMGGLLATSATPSLNAEAARSVTLKTLSGFLPPPSSITANLRGILDASGLPDVFIGLEPSPAPPVPGPGQAKADAIATNAINSTVEVAAEACGYTLTGTGFAVADGYIATNAHVVAGEHTVVVRLGGESYDSTLVFFDPELDIALLYAPDLHAPALRFASADPARGAQAAALGHPGGGPLVILPAAVTGTYTATGRDLYGTQTVSRDIVELQATVQRGDSGGPLILSNGLVGGVVFAASRTDGNVGYALSPTAVSADVMPAVGRTDAVSAGACVQ